MAKQKVQPSSKKILHFVPAPALLQIITASLSLESDHQRIQKGHAEKYWLILLQFIIEKFLSKS